MTVRALADADRPWLRSMVASAWGLPVVSTSGAHDPSELPGFVAEEAGRPVGAVTYRIADGECEVVTLNSAVENRGHGSALLDAVRAAAAQHGCTRVWLITTNDNIRALRFYQRRGLSMVALHRHFVAAVRRVKPGVDASGHDRIPFQHAIEFAVELDHPSTAEPGSG